MSSLKNDARVNRLGGWGYLIFLLVFALPSCIPDSFREDQQLVTVGFARNTDQSTVTPQIKFSVTSTSKPVVSTTPMPTSTTTSTPTLTPFPEPLGCQKPEEDYAIVQVNGWHLNRRTYLMLQHAAELYNGEIDIVDYAITQGSYHDNGTASFGTHLGGGAVDLSVMRAGTYTVLWDDIPRLLRALRISGFAAWFRRLDEIFPGSPMHIHAIAIADEHLSQAAQEQLTGPFGYFRGFSGIPQTNGIPVNDLYGAPLLCKWMVDVGYSVEMDQ
jgi:hypothetical protein